MQTLTALRHFRSAQHSANKSVMPPDRQLLRSAHRRNAQQQPPPRCHHAESNADLFLADEPIDQDCAANADLFLADEPIDQDSLVRVLGSASDREVAFTV